jgi:hypothetical protein
VENFAKLWKAYTASALAQPASYSNAKVSPLLWVSLVFASEIGESVENLLASCSR